MMSHTKNYKNQPMFHDAIQKIIVARFYGPLCSFEISSYELWQQQF